MSKRSIHDDKRDRIRYCQMHMAQLLLQDIDAETTEKLEKRAKLLGTTPAEAALRLLREHLRSEPDEVGASANDTSDPRFVPSHGILVFTGALMNSAMPDHRELREERTNLLLGNIDEGRF